MVEAIINAENRKATYIVSLFESTVLLDKVKIITSDDDGTLHLLLTDNTGQNSATKKSINTHTEKMIKNEASYKLVF